MAKKTVREVTWKETNNFFFTPKYKYPASVSNRYVFVWDTAKHYRKAIGFASHFIAPNKIACVYLLGAVKEESIRKHLDAHSGNFLVLVFPDSELLEEINNLHELIEGYRKTSVYCKKGVEWQPNLIEDEIKRIESAMRQDKNRFAYLQKHLDEIKKLYLVITTEYPAALQRFQKQWNNTLVAYGLKEGNIRGDEEGHIIDLTEVSKNLYPYGIECGTAMPLSFKSARRERLAESALNGKSELDVDAQKINETPVETVIMRDARTGERLEEYDGYHSASLATGLKEHAIWRVCTGASKSTKYKDKRVVFSKYYQTSEIPKLFYQEVSKMLHRELLDVGYVDISDFKAKIESPPFGFYESNWYTYLLGLVLKKYDDKQYHCNIGIISVDPDNLAIKQLIMADKSNKRRVTKCCVLYKQTTAQEQYVRLLRKLFHLSPEYKTRADVERGVAQWCEKNVAVSCLDMIDSRLSIVCKNATLQHFATSPYDYYYSFAYGYEDDYFWLRENFDSIKNALNHLDDDLFKLLSDKYGEDKAKRYFKYAYHSPIARSWVWGKETLAREVEWFMNNSVFCRECEKMIRDHEGVNDEVIDPESGRKRYITHAVHLKDVIALNQKLIGRNVTQYYCIDCLCDICCCEPIDLVNKIQQFKEEGCTLFS